MRTLTSVLGNSQRLDGGAMFGNAPRALWSRWLAPDDKNRVLLSCRTLLVRDDQRWILFETGIGAFFSPRIRERFGVVESDHVLIENLGQLGVSPADIDVIVLSHLHFDHAGGLLGAYREGAAPALVFPNAAILVGEKAWERASHPHPRDRASFIPEIAELLQASGRLEIVSGNASATLGDGYRFHVSDGHTPGMMLTEIAMPGGPILFAADLIPGRAWVHLPITMGYDRFPELLIDEKRAILESLAERGGRLFYTHDASCALSSVSLEAGRFAPVGELARLDGLNV